jgi:hypothetical protein
VTSLTCLLTSRARLRRFQPHSLDNERRPYVGSHAGFLPGERERLEGMDGAQGGWPKAHAR